MLVSNAGIQIVVPVNELDFGNKCLPSISTGAFLTTPGKSRGAKHGARQSYMSRLCPHAANDEQIPEEAKSLGIYDADVIKNVMPKETVDGEFSTVDDGGISRSG